MSCDIDEASPRAPIYRVGRAPDPWQWTDWSYAPFQNRWDDPRSEYRVLYASSQRLACFLETIGRFPGDPDVVDELAEIELEPGEADHALAAGELNVVDWVGKRRVATAEIGGNFAAVGTSRSLTYLHREVAHVLGEYGFEELDGSRDPLRPAHLHSTHLPHRLRVLHPGSASSVRRHPLPLPLRRRVQELGEIFESATIVAGKPEEIAPGDPDLLEAARRLELTLVG